MNYTIMKNLVFFLAMVLFAGCSSTKVSFDYDRSANFDDIKTFAFSEESLDMGVNQLNRDRILMAVKNNLVAKGLTQDKDANTIVDVHIKGKEVTQANATSTGGIYGGYGRYGRYGMGTGMTTTTVTYDTYTEGTMIITLIDAAAQKILWQGSGTKSIEENLSTEKREETINKVVGEILSKYPPPAQ